MGKMIGSYPTVYNIGHKVILDIFKSSVVIEEKVDGSQFSFGIVEGELKCRSKNKQLMLDAPEPMFIKAVETVRKIESKLHPGWIYRCEFLGSNNHVTLVYDRPPKDYLILFDIMIGEEVYLPYNEKKREAERIGLECVPLLFEGIVESFDIFKQLLQTESILGGVSIEGVVIKNYSLFTTDKKIAIGKYVSEKFKEVHNTKWKNNNPKTTDIIADIVLRYGTEARWAKAVQHLKESGMLEGSLKDIALLINEVPDDILKECEDEIKDLLFKYAWPKIRKGVTKGLPEWYKEKLIKLSFINNS